MDELNNSNKNYVSLDELTKSWFDVSEKKKVFNPWLLQKKIVNYISALELLYDVGEVSSLKNIPSIDDVKKQGPFDIYKTASVVENFLSKYN